LGFQLGEKAQGLFVEAARDFNHFNTIKDGLRLRVDDKKQGHGVNMVVWQAGFIYQVKGLHGGGGQPLQFVFRKNPSISRFPGRRFRKLHETAG